MPHGSTQLPSPFPRSKTEVLTKAISPGKSNTTKRPSVNKAKIPTLCPENKLLDAQLVKGGSLGAGVHHSSV